MVELASKKFVCIVDESKLVDGLGGSKGESRHICMPLTSISHSDLVENHKANCPYSEQGTPSRQRDRSCV
jgi:ribose 5-phosphate isomerase